MVQAKDFLKAGGKIPGDRKGTVYKAEVEALACKIVGLLADASTQEVRRRALDRARRMIGTR